YLTMVSITTNQSEKILKIIEMLQDFVINQNTRPIIDKAPHIKSNPVRFQTAFLFTKDAMKMVRGKNPTIKVINACIPTPCLTSAKKAMSGANDHSKNDTRLGFTFPFRVSTR